MFNIFLFREFVFFPFFLFFFGKCQGTTLLNSNCISITIVKHISNQLRVQIDWLIDWLVFNTNVSSNSTISRRRYNVNIWSQLINRIQNPFSSFEGPSWPWSFHVLTLWRYHFLPEATNMLLTIWGMNIYW
jgi:hypothetical protein